MVYQTNNVHICATGWGLLLSWYDSGHCYRLKESLHVQGTSSHYCSLGRIFHGRHILEVAWQSKLLIIVSFMKKGFQTCNTMGSL